MAWRPYGGKVMVYSRQRYGLSHMGCGESGETSSREGTSEEEDVTGTEGCTGGESGESTSGQGSKAGRSGETEICRYKAGRS